MFAASYFGTEYFGVRYWPPAIEIIDETTPGGGFSSDFKIRSEDERRKRLIVAALLAYGGLI